jgi:hypothetical protein
MILASSAAVISFSDRVKKRAAHRYRRDGWMSSNQCSLVRTTLGAKVPSTDGGAPGKHPNSTAALDASTPKRQHGKGRGDDQRPQHDRMHPELH